MRRRRYRHEPVGGNRVELVAGGGRFYEQLAAGIEAAEAEVLIGTYLWEGDATGRRFLELAGRAARRGVRVALLIDGLGSRGVDIEDIEAVRQDGAGLAIFHALRFPIFDSRLMRRYHCKLALVDGKVAYTGGAGFADAWAARPPREWWDVMVRLEGPIVPRLRTLFATDWEHTAKQPLDELPAPDAEPVGSETLHPLVTRRGRSELRHRLVQAIHEARERICIAAAYFVPGFMTRKALRDAADRGVEVHLLLPGQRTDHFAVWSAGRRYYQGLLQAGVHISEWQRSMFHAKYAVVDDTWGYIGSSNLDNWSARFNNELDVGIHSPGALRELQARFDTDREEAREITLTQWRARPLSLRIAETFFGWFDPLL